MLKKLISHSMLYALAPQIPKIASVFMLPVITSHLTSLDYGIYGVMIAYMGILGGIQDLGLGVVFVNVFYKHKNRWPLIWRLLQGHLMLWGLVTAVLALVLLRIVIPAEAKENYWIIAALSILPGVLFERTSTLGNYYFRFRQKPLFLAFVSIISGFVTIIVTYICIVSRGMGYLGWYVSSFFSSLITFLLYSYMIYWKNTFYPIFKIRKKFIMRHLKVALPMIPHNYSPYLLNSSDRVVLSLFRVDIGRIGLYNMAYTFGSYVNIIGEAVGFTVGPYYAKLYTENTVRSLSDERRLTYFLMGCFFVGTFTISIWLKEIIFLLIDNRELRSCYGLGIIIVMGYAYRPMYWSSINRLIIGKRTASLWRISLVAGILNVILNLIFVPQYGIYATAVNTFVSLLYIGFSGYFLKTYKEMDNLDHHPLLWMSAIILLTILAYGLKDSSVSMKVIVTTCLVGGVVVVVRKMYSQLMAINV